MRACIHTRIHTQFTQSLAQYGVSICFSFTIHFAVELKVDATPVRASLRVTPSRSTPVCILNLRCGVLDSSFSEPSYGGLASRVSVNDRAALWALCLAFITPNIRWGGECAWVIGGGGGNMI